MRILVFVLLLVLLAVAAGVAAQLYLNETLLVQYGEWSAQPRVSIALAVLVAGLICALLLMRLVLLLLFLPVRLANWGRARRAEKIATLRARVMQQSCHGNRRALLKHLTELAPMDAAAAWQAAAVAEELGDTRAQVRHLRTAAEAEDKIIATAAKAKLCMGEQRWAEAEQLLTSAGAPRAALLLAKLHYAVAQARADHSKALAAAVLLRDDCPAKYAPLVHSTLQQQMHAAQDAAQVAAFWRDEVPAADKKDAALLVLYLRTLWQLGDEKAATDGLGAALRQHPQDAEVLRAVVDFGSTAQCEAALKDGEKRAARPEAATDAPLLELLEALADKLQLPGKARMYGQRLAALQGAGE